MNDHVVDVNTMVEPDLFPGGAICVTLEALIDPEDATTIFVVRAQDVGAGKLVALWSSSPMPNESVPHVSRAAIGEFTRILDRYTGPF
jgi:hypothetical protein